ncbi:hypothetical protein [Helicobacter japonicus]|nr:hypothetical protein [Helicobacter japonicus]
MSARSTGFLQVWINSHEARHQINRTRSKNAYRTDTTNANIARDKSRT